MNLSHIGDDSNFDLLTRKDTGLETCVSSCTCCSQKDELIVVYREHQPNGTSPREASDISRLDPNQ